jgi:hypothetical protein
MELLAYLDPGSGSMLLQVLLGGIAGIAVSIKMFGKRIFRIFTFWKKHDDEPAGPVGGSAAAAVATGTGEHELPGNDAKESK